MSHAVTVPWKETSPHWRAPFKLLVNGEFVVPPRSHSKVPVLNPFVNESSCAVNGTFGYITPRRDLSTYMVAHGVADAPTWVQIANPGDTPLVLRHRSHVCYFHCREEWETETADIDSEDVVVEPLESKQKAPEAYPKTSESKGINAYPGAKSVVIEKGPGTSETLGPGQVVTLLQREKQIGRIGPGTPPNRTSRAPDALLRGDDGRLHGCVPCLQEYQPGPVCIQRLIGDGNEGSELATHSPPNPYDKPKGDVYMQHSQPEYSEASSSGISKSLITESKDRYPTGSAQWRAGLLHEMPRTISHDSQNIRCLNGFHPVHLGREEVMTDDHNHMATSNSLEFLETIPLEISDRIRHANVYNLQVVDITSLNSV